jgi:hypothetical protein
MDGGGHVTCSGLRERCTGFLRENLEERDHLEDVCVSGKIIITMKLKEIGWESVNWIHV